jgi:hypothetical protein
VVKKVVVVQVDSVQLYATGGGGSLRNCSFFNSRNFIHSNSGAGGAGLFLKVKWQRFSFFYNYFRRWW